jgi:anthranilate phosphoribosyltransferase
MNQNSILWKLIEKRDLNREEAKHYLGEVMLGNVSEISLASFLTALKIKNVTVEELTGFVNAVREASVKRSYTQDFPFLDTCGTGGDGKKSLNISTISALTLGSMGVKVAKHGNRSVSSLCGSSDLLESLGYNYHVDHKIQEERLAQDGFTFLFAPSWHPAMKHAANVRKTLGFSTIFNLIGPLANPLSPPVQILGVYEKDLIHKMADVLKQLNLKKAIVCHSKDGYDEFSLFAETEYIFMENGVLSHHLFSPKSLHSIPFKPEEITVNTKEDATRMAKEVISGKESAGTHAVALNAGVGLFLMNKANSIKEGYKMALSQVLSEKVSEYLKKLIRN